MPKAVLPAPHELRADAGNGKATLTWSIERTDSVLISGYNIYIAAEDLFRDTTAWKMNPGKPYNMAPYPGDVDGEIGSESYPLDALKNGLAYYAQVKTLGIDGLESEPSNIVKFMPLARGEFIISANHLASDGGFNFESGISVPGNGPRSDIYLFATESKMGLSSPNRLGPGLRKTQFGIGGSTPTEETIRIADGSTITLKIKTGRAEIKIDEIRGRYPDISVRIRYTYYPDLPARR